MKRLVAEALGTFVLVAGGCGSAVLSAAFPELGIGFMGVALAFGLSVLVMAYAVGHISGGHFNPARSTAAALFQGDWAVDVLVNANYRCRDRWFDLPRFRGKSSVISLIFSGSAAVDPHFPASTHLRLTP